MTVNYYDTNADLQYSYTMDNPRTYSIIDKIDKDKIKEDKIIEIDDPIIPDSKPNNSENHHPKVLVTALLFVGISFASIFGALFLINFVKIKYRRRKHAKKLAKITSNLTNLTDDSISQIFNQKYNEFDFEDIEMMNKTQLDMTSYDEDYDENESYSISSFNKFKPIIPTSTIVSNTNTSNGMIYSKPKHIRAHTVI